MSKLVPLTIRVGFTEAHGMAQELAKSPPASVEYSFLKPSLTSVKIIRSQIKGYFRDYDGDNVDVIEAIISPVFTTRRWIYSVANFHEAMAFNILGIPIPREIRFLFMKRLMLKHNFKKLIFWSYAGKQTLLEYCSENDNLLKKCEVVYPAIRRVPDELIQFSDESSEVQLLFSGDFFRKGGVNVVDAFELVQKKYPGTKLVLCCDRNIDFNTGDDALKKTYLQKIEHNPGIIAAGRIPREKMLHDVLPKTDIYLLPTYVEAFGFAILEAMAYGIPVISTNHFAIPEMIEHGVSGSLIDTSDFDCTKMFRGYVVNEIPEVFNKYVTEKLYEYLCLQISSPETRKKFGTAGLEMARTRFSFEERNRKMLSIYSAALNDQLEMET